MLKRLLSTLSLGLFIGSMSAQVVVYYEDFEGATAATYTGSTTAQAIAGLSNWEYLCSNTLGEMSTTQVAQSGTKALAMYEGSGSTEPLNEVYGTYDMSAYSVADSIDLELYILHNNDEADVFDRIWVRGNNAATWIEVVNLSTELNTSNDNIWLNFTIDFDSALAAAGQDFSTTTQVRVGQQDNSSWTGGDGIAVDDVSIISYQYGVNISGNDVACFNDPAGYAVASATLGSSPYSYAWSTGATTDSIGGLGPGTYCVTVTDNNNDTTSNCFTVIGTDSISSQIVILQDMICNYDQTEVQVVGTGGQAFTEAYVMDTNSANYSWDSAGTCQTLALTGGNVTALMDIGFDFEFYGNTYDQLQVAGNGFVGFGGGLDNGCCSGEPLPDNSAFEPNNAIFAGWFDVDNFTEYSMCLAGEAPSRRLIINFVGLGDCTTDDNMTAQIILHEGSNCIEIQTDYMTYGGCYGTTDDNTQGMQNLGGTVAQVYPGRNGEAWEADDSYLSFCPVDTGNLIYAWDNGFIGSNISGLGTGSHVVSVTDAFGCFVEDTITFDPPSNLAANPSIDDVTCFGFNDGAINPIITGEFGSLTYDWSNGASTASLSNLGPGNYGVTAEDALNCTIVVDDLVVLEPALLLSNVYNIVDPVCPDDGTGEASMNVTGGVPPYSVTWNPGGFTGTQVSGLNAGNYQAVITDSSGCQSFKAVSLIAQNEAPEVDLGPDIYQQSSNPVTLNAGSHASTLWSTGETSQSITVTSAGTYWAQATNEAGCIGSDTIFVDVWPLGLEEFGGESSLVLYPNPARENITLNWNSQEDLKDIQITITNVMGAVVYTEQVGVLNSGQLMELNLAELPAGTYQLSVKNDSFNATKAFIKQ